MLDIAHFLIGSALAQDAAAPATATASASPMAGIVNFLPLVLIFLVFYVLIINPQRKKMAEQDKMVKALQRGDRIITNGGIFGKITKLEDETLIIEIADNVNIKILRNQVQGLAAKTNTATVANDGSEEKKN